MLVIGHRGAPVEAPENTIASFDAAIDAGVDGIETDIRLSSDGVLVLSHDDRQSHGGRISGMSVGELESAGGILRFETFLERYAGRTRLYLECKGIFEPGRPFVSAEPVARALVPLLTDVAIVADVTVSSFDPTAVAAVRELAPHLEVGLGCAEMFPLGPVLSAAADAGYRQVHPSDAAVDVDVAAQAMLRGVELLVWTVNDPVRAKRLRELGVHAVFTDDPRGLRAAGV